MTENWTYERQDDDTPVAKSCSGPPSNRVCVAVTCRSEAGLTFEYFGPGKPSSEDEAGGSIFVSTLNGVRKVDIDCSLLNRPFTRRAPLDSGLADLLMLWGTAASTKTKNASCLSPRFTSIGSADAIDAVRLRCR